MRLRTNQPASTDGKSRRSFLREAIGGATLWTAGATETIVGAAEEKQPAEKTTRFPFYHAHGTHRELGRQHGKQAAEQIAAHLDYMRNAMKLSQRDLKERALQFRPLFKKHCPHLLDEIVGLAEGARISTAEALAVNVRGALTTAKASAPATGNSRRTDDGCTAFAIRAKETADGGILIGQNSDMLPDVVKFGYVLHLKPKDKPDVLMWSFGGMIGYHGLNRHGVANFANDLGGGPKPRFGMPHYPLKRLALECRTLDEVLRLFRRVPLWANGNYVLCDGMGRILDVEATTAGPEVIADNGAGYIAHANHFLSRRYATKENHKLSVADSFTRQQRIEKLIEERLGKTTLDDVKSYLRTRDRHTTGICRVARTADRSAGWVTAGITAASLIAAPAKLKLHVAASNDPANPFVEYAMS